MEHLSTAELNDCARGIRRAAHPHLAECGECSDIVAFLRKVAQAALPVAVPPEAVAEAKRISHRPAAPVPAEKLLQQVIARLVFLQTGGQRPAEVRSVQSAARQAVYRYGEYFVDLRTEEEPDGVKTSLVGQIAHQHKSLEHVRIPVALVTANRVLQQTVCNDLGEFAIDFVNNRRLRLKFDLPSDGLTIEVPLKDLGKED